MRTIFSFSLLFILNLNAIAETLTPSEPTKFSASVGGGLAFKTNIRRDNQYKHGNKSYVVTPIPLAQVSYGPVNFGQGGLSVNVAGYPFLGAYVNLNRVGDRYDGIGMDSRKESFALGIGARLFGFNIHYGSDIASKSNGGVAKLGYGKMFFINPDLMIRVGGGIDYLTSNYVNYYYGVRSNEATSTRSVYSLNHAVNYSFGAFPIYKISAEFSAMSGVNTTLIDSKIRRSPTTNGKAYENAFFAGVTYKFL